MDPRLLGTRPANCSTCVPVLMALRSSIQRLPDGWACRMARSATPIWSGRYRRFVSFSHACGSGSTSKFPASPNGCSKSRTRTTSRPRRPWRSHGCIRQQRGQFRGGYPDPSRYVLCGPRVRSQVNGMRIPQQPVGHDMAAGNHRCEAHSRATRSSAMTHQAPCREVHGARPDAIAGCAN
ncbi:hypothetical protein R75461_08287 [Paraburkholderia nemoris]|nr:hypothetical protein R75461_08287 [Paraburkholderia nemoris]